MSWDNWMILKVMLTIKIYNYFKGENVRRPKDSEEYISIITIIFFIISILMVSASGLVLNTATITFLVLGIILFLASIMWIITGLTDDGICFDWLFESEEN